MAEPLQPIQPNDFLTLEESAAVDQALLTSREKFTSRVAIYSLRSLKQISQETGVPIKQLPTQAIVNWVERDQSTASGLETDASFKSFFTQLVLSSLKPLTQAAQEAGTTIEELSPTQVIAFFEKEAKDRIAQNH